MILKMGQVLFFNISASSWQQKNSVPAAEEIMCRELAATGTWKANRYGCTMDTKVPVPRRQKKGRGAEELSQPMVQQGSTVLGSLLIIN